MGGNKSKEIDTDDTWKTTGDTFLDTAVGTTKGADGKLGASENLGC
jgi:hypothetical protein